MDFQSATPTPKAMHLSHQAALRILHAEMVQGSRLGHGCPNPSLLLKDLASATGSNVNSLLSEREVAGHGLRALIGLSAVQVIGLPVRRRSGQIEPIRAGSWSSLVTALPGGLAIHRAQALPEGAASKVNLHPHPALSDLSSLLQFNHAAFEHQFRAKGFVGIQLGFTLQQGPFGWVDLSVDIFCPQGIHGPSAQQAAVLVASVFAAAFGAGSTAVLRAGAGQRGETPPAEVQWMSHCAYLPPPSGRLVGGPRLGNGRTRGLPPPSSMMMLTPSDPAERPLRVVLRPELLVDCFESYQFGGGSHA